jgi:NAD-dependent SIR2 family protein deacetylase
MVVRYIKCHDCGRWTDPNTMDEFEDGGLVMKLCPSCTEKRLSEKKK